MPAPAVSAPSSARREAAPAWPRLAWRRRDLRHLTGPFDVVGDVHGCHEELVALLVDVLGYRHELTEDGFVPVPPAGRTLVFVGDLVDRGPDCTGVLQLARGLVAAGRAVLVCGNHDAQLADYLVRGRPVSEGWGTEPTLAQLAGWPAQQRTALGRFLDQLPAHVVLAGGGLVVAHAGTRRDMLVDIDYEPCETPAARARALHGEFRGRGAHGELVRCFDWLDEERPKMELVYGHTVVATPHRHRGATNLDTGCVYGGSLTALRWPEQTLHAVPARRCYWD